VASANDLPIMSASKWRSLLNGPPVATDSVIAAEDPYEEAFTENVVFHGGSYVVLPGLFNSGAQVIQRLLTAALLVPPQMSDVLRTQIREMGSAILSLSDAVCTRAGLARYVPPKRGKGYPSVVPESARFQRMKQAVQFSAEELTDLLGPHWQATLAPFVFLGSEISESDIESEEHHPLAKTPIVDLGDGLCVVAPSLLITALRHHIIMAARTTNELEELSGHLQMASAVELNQSLTRYGFVETIETDIALDSGYGIEMLHKFDGDKILHTVLITDSLEDYGAESVWGRWDTPGLSEWLEPRLAYVEKWSVSNEMTAVLHLVVAAGVGRWHVASVKHHTDNDRMLVLPVSIDDLHIMARSDPGDPLALWKFAYATERLLAKTRVASFSKLDLFEIYSSNENSYCISDEAPMDLWSVAPDTALELRLKDAHSHDVHGVGDWAEAHVVRVERLYPRSEVPIYVASAEKGDLAFYLETPEISAWVRLTEFVGESAEAWDYLEATVYWAWQISRFWSSDGTTSLSHLNIEVSISSVRDEDATSDRWFTLNVVYDRVRLRIIPSKFAESSTAVNSNERVLVRGLIELFGDLAGRPTGSQTSALVDQVAPLGVKKKVLALDVSNHLALLPGAVRNPRRIQKADISNQLDELGAWAQGQMPVGPVAPDERVAFLNDLVEHEFQVFVGLVAEVPAVDLIEMLIEQNEGLIRSEALRDLTLPTRSACFEDDKEILDELIDDASSEVMTAVVTRFCLEYTAAIPPQGTNHLTLERYDTLLSCASEIISKGLLSDAIQSGIADLEISLLPSGRIGISREDPYSRAVETFRGVQAAVRMEGTESAFARHWHISDELTAPPGAQEFSKAFDAEFGVPIDKMGDLTGTIISLGNEIDGEPKSMAEEEFVARVASAMGWPSSRVIEVVSTFSITRRPTFVPPKRSRDVYPWRYTRRLSYLRRPFIRYVDDSGEQLVYWGSRNVARLGHYLISQVMNGKYEASSGEMATFVGKVRSEEPHKFGDRLAADIQTRFPDWIVKVRVTSIGGRKLERPNGDVIGDIDVLAVDPGRKRIIPIEAKDFSLARTAQEVASEFERLFVGEGSAVSHHSERVEWLKKNHDHVIAHFGFSSPRHWKVTPFIVSSQELMTPLIKSSAIEVVSADRLWARLGHTS